MATQLARNTAFGVHLAGRPFVERTHAETAAMDGHMLTGVWLPDSGSSGTKDDDDNDNDEGSLFGADFTTVSTGFSLEIQPSSSSYGLISSCITNSMPLVYGLTAQFPNALCEWRNTRSARQCGVLLAQRNDESDKNHARPPHATLAVPALKPRLAADSSQFRNSIFRHRQLLLMSRQRSAA